MSSEPIYRLYVFDQQDSNQHSITQVSNLGNDGDEYIFRVIMEEFTTDQIAMYFNVNYAPGKSHKTSSNLSRSCAVGTIGQSDGAVFKSVKAMDERFLQITSDHDLHYIDMRNKVIAIKRGPDINGNIVEFVYITESLTTHEADRLKQRGETIRTDFIAPGYSCTEEATYYANDYYIDMETAIQEHVTTILELEKLKNRG